MSATPYAAKQVATGIRLKRGTFAMSCRTSTVRSVSLENAVTRMAREVETAFRQTPIAITETVPTHALSIVRLLVNTPKSRVADREISR